MTMTTTQDDFSKLPFIKRDHLSHIGEVFAESTLAPSVLPMTGFSLDTIEAAIWLKAVKTRTGHVTKGEVYRLAHIHSNGQVLVTKPNGDRVQGLFPMDLFAEYVTSEVKIVGQPDQPPKRKGDGEKK